MERSTSVERWISLKEKKQIPSEKQYGFIVVDKKSVVTARIIGNKLQVLSTVKHKLHSTGELEISPTSLDIFTGLGPGRINVYDGFTLANGNHRLQSPPPLDGMCRFYLGNTKLTKVEVDVGGERGLHQAIKLSPYMNETRFMEEIVILEKFFKEVSEGRYSLGVKKTVEHLTKGKVDTLVISDQLLIKVYVQQNEKIMYERPTMDLEIFFEEHLLLDWIANNYETFSPCNIEFVGSTSDLGHQFLKGLGGIGAILVERVEDTDAEGSEEVDAAEGAGDTDTDTTDTDTDADADEVEEVDAAEGAGDTDTTDTDTDTDADADEVEEEEVDDDAER